MFAILCLATPIRETMAHLFVFNLVAQLLTPSTCHDTLSTELDLLLFKLPGSSSYANKVLHKVC